MKTRLIILFGLLAAVAAGLGAISTGPISGGTGPTGPAGANPPTVLRKAAVSKPLIGIANWMDYWYQTNLAYGNWMMGEPGEDVASNSVVFAKANKIEWLRIDRGWAATNRTAGGVVTWNTNKFPRGMPWLLDFAHTNGVKVDLSIDWTYLHNTTGGGTIDTPLGGFADYTQIPADVKAMASWGVDGICLLSDATWSLNPMRPDLEEQRVAYIAVLDAVADAASQTFIGSNVTPGVVVPFSVPPQHYAPANSNYWWFAPEVLQANNLYVQPSFQFPNVVGIQDWARTNFATWSSFVGPGRYLHANSWSDSVYAQPALYKAGIEYMGMLGVGYWATYGIAVNPVYLAYITNANFNVLRDDPNAIPGWQVFSNRLAEVWLRPVRSTSTNSASNMVLLSNGGASTNFILTAGMLGLSSNLVWKCTDVWYQTNFAFTNYSQSLTLATNTTMLLLVEPLYTTGNFQGDGRMLSNVWSATICAQALAVTGVGVNRNTADAPSATWQDSTMFYQSAANNYVVYGVDVPRWATNVLVTYQWTTSYTGGSNVYWLDAFTPYYMSSPGGRVQSASTINFPVLVTNLMLTTTTATIPFPVTNAPKHFVCMANASTNASARQMVGAIRVEAY